MKTIFSLIFLVVIIFYSCSTTSEPIDNNTTPPTINSVHTALGVPTDNDSTDDFYIIRPQYVLSYNKNLNVCNWVAYELNADWFGDEEIYDGDFITDTTLPPDFYQVKHSDYNNSGYEQGQMVMIGQRSITEDDMKSTFILSAILPLTKELNKGLLLDWTYYINQLAGFSKKQLYIVGGGIFQTKQRINNIVTIPDSVFNIIVVLEKGQGLKDVNINTEVLAFVIPNTKEADNVFWLNYETTVDRIESSTGYDFLSSVSKKVQAVIEKK